MPFSCIYWFYLGNILIGENMRKGILLILICMTLLSFKVESKSNELGFIIYYDSLEENQIKKKNEIVELINSSLKYVNEDSWNILLSSTHELENNEREVWVEDERIVFKLGDGLGNRINGNIVSHSFCLVEVKPKSLIRKWFNF